MFLTKKSTGAPKQKPKNSKALGGWDDEEEDASPQLPPHHNHNHNNRFPQTKSQELGTQEVDLLNGVIGAADKGADKGDYKGGSQEIKGKDKEVDVGNKKLHIDQLYTEKQLNSMKNIQCQKKLIQTLITPSGIRIKPSDTHLSQFLSQAKSLQIPIISSILISHLYCPQNPFQKKARALYTIEYLSKKNIQYSVYFKLHSQKIKKSPSLEINEEENIENYQKIRKVVLAALGVGVCRPEDRDDGDQVGVGKSEMLEFVDPGYNNKEDILGITSKKSESQKQKPSAPAKKFISPSEIKAKKALQGPGSKNQPQKAQEQDLLQVGTVTTAKKQKQVDLLQVSSAKKQQNLLEFSPNNGKNGDLLI